MLELTALQDTFSSKQTLSPHFTKNTKFQNIAIIIVKSKGESGDILDFIRELHDSGTNNWCWGLNKEVLKTLMVISIDEIADFVTDKDIATVRIDDLPLKDLSKIIFPEPTDSTVQQVQQAIKEARKAASEAAKKVINSSPRNGNGHLMDVFGFADICTSESQSEITAALIKLGLATPIGGTGYSIKGVKEDIGAEFTILCVAEAAAEAGAQILRELLGQDFYVNTRWD